MHRDPKELCLQVLDIVTVRPEIGIIYILIQNKCYEILEGRRRDRHDIFDDSDDSESQESPPHTGGQGLQDGNDDDNDDDDDTDDDDDGNDDDDTFDDDSGFAAGNSDDDEYDGPPSNYWASEISSAGPAVPSDEDETRSENGGVKFQLRQISFYDDRVAVFRARHASL